MPASIAAGFERMLDDLRTVPGVRYAAIAAAAPMTGMQFGGGAFAIDKQAGDQAPRAAIFHVSDGFFETLGIPVLRGRDFRSADTQFSEWVAIVNDVCASQYWPNVDPVGHYISLPGPGDPRRYQIVGVVPSVRYGRVDQPPVPTIYIPHQQKGLVVHSSGWLSQVSRTFLLKLSVPADRVLPAIRAIGARHTGNQPIFEVQTMEELQGEQYRAPRFGVTLVSIFASFGLILAAAGVYGVMSYSVVQRSSEIGIRMALGAQRTNIAAMILGEGLKIAAIGITVGLIGAIAAGRLLGKLLFDVKPTDAATLVGVSLVFFAVLLLAC